LKWGVYLKRLAVISFCLLLLGTVIISPHSAFAQSNDNNVLVVYSIDDQEQIKVVRILETIIGQFKSEYTLVEDKDFKSSDLNDYKQVIYLGAGKTAIPDNVINAINNYEGKFYAIGHNADQLREKLAWITLDGETLISKVEANNRQHELPEERIVYNVSSGNAEVLANGMDKDGKFIPLLLQSGDDFYFAGQNLFNPFGEEISETLNQFFGETTSEKIRYLRLEDVHPMVDPKQLKEQAEYLKEKHIPYMVAVIPVYSKDGKIVHLSDKPEMVKTLQYMQDNGASIVMHGYKHQYRSSETGEGFEFWDTENDRPIYQEAEEKAKVREDFPADEEYNSFIENGEEFETAYIENALEKGIQELVAHDLYPLAFEAPHYAISQNGYKVVSEHFSSYVGQLQLTDLTWQGEYAPMYESKPEFINGMTLYPETLGYIEQGGDQAFKEMADNIKNRQYYTQTYLSAFYHPYLGLDGLKKVVSSLESVEDSSWLDLKQEANVVKVNDIRIESQNGKIEIEKPFFSSDYERNLIIKKAAVWVIPIGILIIAAVVLLVVRKRKQSNKDKLNFKEAK
jgi:uncharacterized protein YdaL